MRFSSNKHTQIFLHTSVVISSHCNKSVASVDVDEFTWYSDSSVENISSVSA